MAALIELVSRRTRFRAWRPWAARAVLVCLAALIGYGAVSRPLPTAAPGAPPETSDLALYAAIAARVAAGEGYYVAATAEHRKSGYPLKPFFTVRPPTLAVMTARLGEDGVRLALSALVATALIAFGLRMRSEAPPGIGWVFVSAATLAGLAPAMMPIATLLHESWVAPLLVLSLACRSPGRLGLSVGLGVAAVSIRELALPYLVAMAAVAWWEGHRREAGAWLCATLVCVALLAAHAWLVAAQVAPDDLVSPGWVGLAGWPLILTMIGSFSALVRAPLPALALVAPLCLVGWVAWDSPVGRRGALVTLGYVFAFMTLARPDNVYWGLMISPLFLTGLAFAPAALRDLWGASEIGRAQPSTVTLSPS